MKRLFTYTLFILFFANYMLFLGNTSGSLPTFTGAPGEDTCGADGCHNTMANLGMAQIEINFNDFSEDYTPGETYPVQISIADPQHPKNGFQITALDDQNSSVGTLVAGTGTKRVNGPAPNNRSYITHTNQGVNQSSWTIDWTAPQNYNGPVKFYLAVNDTNGNNNKSGDDVYTTNLEIKGPSASNQSIDGLEQLSAYPNPFIDNFTISFKLIQNRNVNIAIYNRQGQMVNQVFEGDLNAGNHNFMIDRLVDFTKDLYFVNIKEINGGNTTLKLIKL